MPITATLDHVAVAVHSIEDAAARWHDELGGGWVSDDLEPLPTPVAVRQLRYANTGKLELLQPSGPGFARSFLERFGPRIHHLTVTVPDDLTAAVETLRAEGYEVVDVHTEGDWHEAFLRPAQVGGLVVQVAWEELSEGEWFARSGHVPEEPRGATALLGPTLTHPDLEVAERLWHGLGGTVTRTSDALLVTWPDSVLDVRVEQGPTAGPLGLRFTGADPLPGDDVAGPPVLVA